MTMNNRDIPFFLLQLLLFLQPSETDSTIDTDDFSIKHRVLDDGAGQVSKLAGLTHAVRVDHVLFQVGIPDGVAHRGTKESWSNGTNANLTSQIACHGESHARNTSYNDFPERLRLTSIPFFPVDPWASSTFSFLVDAYYTFGGRVCGLASLSNVNDIQCKLEKRGRRDFEFLSSTFAVFHFRRHLVQEG